MSKYLINLASNIATMGNVFTTENSYIFKNQIQYFLNSTFAFTKTLLVPDLRVFKETLAGTAITNFTQITTRESLPSDVPVTGPFIESYSKDGTINTDSFVNLLLLDKPPIRTGFFDFFIGGQTFTGVVTRLTPYKHYNWERTGSKYGYVEQPTDLGYGIEISKNSLYRAEEQPDGSYLVYFTPLYLFLINLTGNEEIISTPSSANPNSYINNIPGLPDDTIGSLPISLFYISEADALRYIASYPELIEELGADPIAGQQRYAQATENKIITFNPIAYLNKYSDIRALYGYDTYAATVHYITAGYYQGRTIENASTVDPLVGGLYDERTGAVQLTNNLIVWPHGETILNSGDGITYKYNNKIYSLNIELEPRSELKYLGVH
jgi:hypothetical protein